MRIERTRPLGSVVVRRSALLASFVFVAAVSAATNDGFDSVPDHSPADLLPAAMVAGPDFHVVDPVHGDGLMNHFVIESRFGKFESYGRVSLALRIREIAALTELAKTSDAQVVASGAVSGIASEVKTAAQVVSHPVDTVTGIPKGIGHLFSGYHAEGDELMRGAKSTVSSMSSSSGGSGSTVRTTAAKGESAAKHYAERYLGVTAAERNYYRKFGVDPYTDNKVLRDAIRRDAKISAAAGFGVKFAALPAIPAIGITQQVVDAIYNEDPAVIRERTRKTLAGFGLSAAEIAAFMNAPLLSPSRQVVLLSAAQSLQGVANRGELFRHALGLTSNEEVQVYVRSVGLLVKAHESRALNSVIAGVRLPAALRADNSIVVCGAFEDVYWTNAVAKDEAQLRHALPSEPPGAAREVWFAGNVSQRALLAMRDRGWELHQVAVEADLARATP